MPETYSNMNVNGKDGIFTFQYLPREQLVTLLQGLQAENVYLRSQLTDYQERNRILQHTLPQMLKEFLAQMSTKSSVRSEHCPARSTQVVTDFPPEAQPSLIQSYPSVNCSKGSLESLGFKSKETQTMDQFVDTTMVKNAVSLQSNIPNLSSSCTARHSTLRSENKLFTATYKHDSVNNDTTTFSSVGCVNKPLAMETSFQNNSAEPINMKIHLDPMRVDINPAAFQQIKARILSNPKIVQSRDWSAYKQASEWTRATCSLMSALFTSDQMARCTVLGRGIKEPRQRLPMEKTFYIIEEISKRFNVSPTRIRARMAQKCKDERRKQRNNLQNTVLIQ